MGAADESNERGRLPSRIETSDSRALAKAKKRDRRRVGIFVRGWSFGSVLEIKKSWLAAPGQRDRVEPMEVSMLEESEWVRLPGLFRWDEICDVFATEATPDREWHFVVKLASEPDGPELLYVIHAAQDAAQ